ncbi:MAG: hypothetical protein ACRD3V_11920 [Vicinamibacteria bacterium]
MTDSKRQRLLDEITRFRLAQSDMRQVIAAAETLAEEHHHGDLCRALETAIVVCYARPFGRKNAVGALGRKWEPLKQFPKLHAELLRLRNKVYAHTDKTEARQVVDIAAMLGLESPAWTEGWHPINREALPPIIALARQMEASLAAAVDDRLNRLSG